MENAISFRDEFVPMLLSGAKTQTRRLITPKPSLAYIRGDGQMGWNDSEGNPRKNMPCPFGGEGDTLWVKETWDEKFFPERHFAYKANDPEAKSLMSGIYEWKNRKDMPRYASRCILKIEEIRIEKLSEMSESDAVAEGFVSDWDNAGFSAVNAFAEVWDDIYGDGSFDSDPYVWVIIFSRC